MKTEQTSNYSIFDNGMSFDGMISSKGKLIIKGAITGIITGEDIIISQGGAVSAKISVDNITIGGDFKGEIKAFKKIILLSTGCCSGKITCQDLIVEAGGNLYADVTTVLNPKDNNYELIHEENSQIEAGT